MGPGDLLKPTDSFRPNFPEAEARSAVAKQGAQPAQGGDMGQSGNRGGALQSSVSPFGTFWFLHVEVDSYCCSRLPSSLRLAVTIVTLWNVEFRERMAGLDFHVIDRATFKQVPARQLANVVLVFYLTPTSCRSSPLHSDLYSRHSRLMGGAGLGVRGRFRCKQP